MLLELSLHASSLKNVAGAFRGLSDPFAVVTRLASRPGIQPLILGRTETIKNQLSPQWVDTITIEYRLGAPLKIAVTIFDDNSNRENKVMGNAVFEIGEILGATGNAKGKRLKKGGILYAIVRKVRGKGAFRLKMRGEKLKNVEGLFGKSDPFFEISKKGEARGTLAWDNIYRSDAMKNVLDPDWDFADIQISTLCNGDLNLPLQIAVYDYESSGRHKIMGRVETTANDLVYAASTKEELILKLGITKPRITGKLIIEQADVDKDAVAEIVAQNAAEEENSSRMSALFNKITSKSGKEVSFIDYVSGGCELNVAIAIDYTASNGDPRKPESLHYLFGGSPEIPNHRNDYEKAMIAMIGILSKYDTDQMYPVYGFGAKYAGITQHCFQCGNTLSCRGLKGILEAYHRVFRSGLIMSGPTKHSQVITAASHRAEKAQEHAAKQGRQAYTILLILTNDNNSDIKETVDALREASTKPLSIVIIGIGNTDFSGMQFLDDFNNEENGGHQRDIVQFVEFSKYAHNSELLTSETLDEIPNQLVEYFLSNDIFPSSPVRRKSSMIKVEDAQQVELYLDVAENGEIVIKSGGEDFTDGYQN